MNLLDKIVDFLVKPINTAFLVGIFLVSIFVFGFNFIPDKILINMNLKTLIKFLNSYNFVLFLIIVFSMFFLIVQGIGMLLKKHEDKKILRDFKKQQENLFNDEDAWKILKIMYENHPSPTKLPNHNQKVVLLRQYGLIAMASTQIYIQWYDDPNNPEFPYILQPVSEERLKDNLDEKMKK